jgi:dephospho-CoA kinase
VTGRPLRVALTGGLATGKSFCLRAFARLGAPVIDADALARAVVEPGTPGLALVVRRFGTGVLAPSGHLNREALGRLVFNDADARRDLEAIVHPEVYARVRRWFDELGDAPAGVAEIPLLYESDHAADFDRVVVAACSREEQKRRAMARDGLSESEVERRLAAQLPIDEKRRQADAVVDTSGSPDETERQVRSVWEKLLGGVLRST